MAKKFQVSVGTLRKALNELKKKNLIKRIQGSGNYILNAENYSSIYSMFRLELHEGGGLPSASIIAISFLLKPKTIPSFGVSIYASRIRRLRYLNDKVVAIEEIWVDGSLGQIMREELTDSLYIFYQKKLGIWINHAEDRVSIGKVPRWAPKSFTVLPNHITSFVERLTWASGDSPIEYSRTWYDHKRAYYVQRLK